MLLVVLCLVGVLSIPFFNLRDMLTIAVLAAILSWFAAGRGQSQAALFRLVVGGTAIQLMLRLPPPSPAIHLLATPVAVAEWIHLAISILGVCLLAVPLVRRREQRLDSIDQAILLGFSLVMLYSVVTPFFGRLLRVSYGLNPRVLPLIAAATVIGLLSRETVLLAPTWRRWFAGILVAILSVILLLQAGRVFKVRSALARAEHHRLAADFTAARSDYQRALALNHFLGIPRFSLAAMKNLGLISFRQGTFGDAESWFRRAVELRPRDPFALFGLGLALQRTRDNREAQACFRQLGRLSFSLEQLRATFDPPAETFNLLGKVFREMGEFQRAIDIFKLAGSQGDLQGETAFQLGSIYASQGDADEAFKHLKQAERLGYRSPELFFELAGIFYRRHDLPRAGRNCQKAINTSPGYLAAYDLWEKVLQESGETEQLETVRQSRAELLPTQTMNDLRTDAVEILGFTLPQREIQQGNSIELFFHCRVLRDLDRQEEPIFLLMGNYPFIYLRSEYNLLEGIRQANRPVFPGDVVVTRCVLDGRTLIPGLCDLSFYLPGDLRLEKRDINKPNQQVDSARFHPLASISILPHLYRRVSFGHNSLKHLFDPGLDQRNLQTYFYLSNHYSIDIPLLENPHSFLANSLLLISSMTFSGDVENGLEIARIIITDLAGREYVWPIRVGLETSEWAWDCPGIRIAHKRAKIALSWKMTLDNREFEAHKYYCRFDFPEPVKIKRLRMTYTAGKGCIEVCDLIAQGTKKKMVLRKAWLEEVVPATGK